ncbi:MAG: hypothetical protein AAFQ63_16480 [Cyanobacteria bacterium J06621_11]
MVGSSPSTTPPLPGENFEFEAAAAVPEPGMVPALVVVGLGMVGIQRQLRR